MTIDQFNFDRLSAPPLSALLTPNDIGDLYTIAHSIKYSAQPGKKMEMMKQILGKRGFVKMSAGTNRIAFKFLEDDSFLLKVAYDDIGRGDNPAEFRNQMFLKPFVTKIFEVDPTGTVGLVERVDPIRNREQYLAIADDVYYLITEILIGKYVLADIGTKFFMNVGIRRGFGVVYLDFPYVFELDGKKLFCNKPDPYSPTGTCDGEIDYDAGFNFLQCKKCGKRYRAKELAVDIENKIITIKERMDIPMKIQITGGTVGKKVITIDENKITQSVVPNKPVKPVENVVPNVIINDDIPTVNGVKEEPIIKPADPQAKKEVKEEVVETPIIKDPGANFGMPAKTITVEAEEIKEVEEEEEVPEVTVTPENVNQDKPAASSPITMYSDDDKKNLPKTIKDQLTKICDQYFILTDEGKAEVTAELEKALSLYKGDIEKKEEEVVEEVKEEEPKTAIDIFEEFLDKLKDAENEEYDNIITDDAVSGFINDNFDIYASTEYTEKGIKVSSRLATMEDDVDQKTIINVDTTTIPLDEIKDNLELIGVGDEGFETEEEVIEEAESVLENTQDGYNDTPIMLGAFTRDIHDLIPSLGNKTVILLETSDGQYLTADEGCLICIDTVDGNKLDKMAFVSKSWYNNTIAAQEAAAKEE